MRVTNDVFATPPWTTLTNDRCWRSQREGRVLCTRGVMWCAESQIC